MKIPIDGLTITRDKNEDKPKSTLMNPSDEIICQLNAVFLFYFFCNRVFTVADGYCNGCVAPNNVKPLCLIINKIDRYIEENNDNNYFALV